MDLLSRDQLKRLMGQGGEPCLSMFMPTHKSGAEIKQDQIRFRNLIREAEENLASRGLRNQEVREFLAPLQGLAANVLFWRKQIDGLAIFVSKGVFHALSLPLPFEEFLEISDRFHIKPLLPLFGQVPRYYLLALSQNQVQLYEGTADRLQEVDIKNLPVSMLAALQYDEPEKQVRFRAGSGMASERGSMMSGHGADIDDTKDNLLKYFRQIDRGVREYLREETAPLVIAGVDYLFPIYKEVNSYQHLMEEGIAGNPKGISAEALHRQAWSLVRPRFRKARENAIEQYRQSFGTGLASNGTGDIAVAAYHGRIGHLFIARNTRQWGFFNPADDAIRLINSREPGSEDLLDFAAIHAYLANGSVFVLAQEEMPDDKPLAAVFRY
ncbi:MAG: hypothetical protein QMD32_04200 [Smithellaceae bacterium]|nr:hypothetical protein [Smithellaceae bacterium]